MSNLTAAVIGTGFIGPVHVEALKRAGVRVAGILGSTAAKSHTAADKLGLERAYQSLDELLDDASVDVVHITSPNRFHHPQTLHALAAGKHVLCEKPLAMSAAQSEELVRVAAQRGVAAAVNYNIRYYPLCAEAAQRVRGGDVGRIFHVAGGYVQDWLCFASDYNWRVLADEGGKLRAIADIGTHWLDLLQFIMGQKVVAVCADLATVHPERMRPLGGMETFSGKLADPSDRQAVPVETEDYGCVMLEFSGGARGVMWVSQVTAGRKNSLRYELAGSSQSLSWNSERPNELWIGARNEANQTLIRDPALISEPAASLTSYPGGHNEGFSDTLKQLFLDFYGAVESGDPAAQPGYPTFADGHHEVLVCEAILESHHGRRWVRIGN
ncbi:MAG: Gfo/Idh/MocA family oxidoreductase [Pirellulales bacterium]|nr:Gfo/Idh/MocA family oxidoreductase [Pirellulales bacterium]